MIIENIETTKAEANAKVIADLEKAKASFMNVRALEREIEGYKSTN